MTLDISRSTLLRAILVVLGVVAGWFVNGIVNTQQQLVILEAENRSKIAVIRTVTLENSAKDLRLWTFINEELTRMRDIVNELQTQVEYLRGLADRQMAKPPKD